MTVLLAACSSDDSVEEDASGTGPRPPRRRQPKPVRRRPPQFRTQRPCPTPRPRAQSAGAGHAGLQRGAVVLDTTVLGSRLVVSSESVDATTWCIEGRAVRRNVRRHPGQGAAEPSLNNSGIYGRAYYHFTVPDDFPAVVRVYDENGDELPAARGRAGPYLVVIDPPAGGPSRRMPRLVERVLDVHDETGATVTQLRFMGFAASDVVTFEQFAACVRDAGVDFQMPGPGEPPPPTA